MKSLSFPKDPVVAMALTGRLRWRGESEKKIKKKKVGKKEEGGAAG